MTDPFAVRAAELGEALERIVDVLGGDVSDVLAELRTGPLSDRFEAWVREGPNAPVTAGEIENALGPAHRALIAERTGVSEQEAVQRIAEELPELIDEATPRGDTSALDTLISVSHPAVYLRAYPGSGDN